MRKDYHEDPPRHPRAIGFALLLILAIVQPSAAALASSSSGERYVTEFELLDPSVDIATADPLTAKRKVKRPWTYDELHPSYGVDSADLDPDINAKLGEGFGYITSVQECVDEQAAQTFYGYIKNHFAQCHSDTFRVKIVEFSTNRPPRVVGSILGRYTMIADAFRTERVVRTEGRYTDLRYFGKATPSSVKLGMEMSFGANSDICNQRSLAQQVKPAGQWSNNNYAFWSISSPASSGYGRDKIAYCDLRFALSVDAQRSQESVNPLDISNVVQCDSAKYIPGAAEACVFSAVEPHLNLSLSDPAVNESAEHIRDAFKRPETTFPRKVNKQIPGEYRGNVGRLTRTIDKREIKASRRAVRKVCQGNFPGYVAMGKDCDEFPYASTKQNAASGGDFSARAIRSGDNQESGRRLGVFYKNDRILDGGEFSVRINP